MHSTQTTLHLQAELSQSLASEAALGFSIIGKKKKKKFYLSPRAPDSLWKTSQNTQTLHHAQTIVVYIFSFSLFSWKKMSLAFWGFITLICSPALTFPTGDWYLETLVGQVVTLVKDQHRRSMWINISHNPAAFESRTGWKGKKAEEKSIGRGLC